MSLEAFREETRTWLEENCPASMRGPVADDQIIGGGKRQEYERRYPREFPWTIPDDTICE